MYKLVVTESDIKIGDVYEDCNYKPCLCVEIEDGDVFGISLIDGSYPHQCSIEHCAIRTMSIEDALKIKFQISQTKKG
jgi:hypothetical protein